MKALEILQSINKRYCTDSVIAKINKAISELEALENRCCDNCKRDNVCNIYKILGSNVGLLVSCKKWESK